MTGDPTQHRIIPVVVLDNAAHAAPLADALVSGGLPVAEVTLRTEAAIDSIATMAARGDLLVGAGTVVNSSQVDQAVEAGATFLVSPGLSAAVVERAHALGVPIFPGCVTPTEIMAALDLGVSTVKFFPAETFGGLGALKALSAPLGQVWFIPTGGIGLDHLADYLALPSVAAVGGSWMVSPALIRAGDFVQITELTRQAVVRAEHARP